MSTIQTNAILDASGGNTTTINGVTPNTDSVRGRNLVINGAMRVAQRGTSFTGLQNSPAYTVDRFEYRRINSWSTAQFAVTQESDGPAGFANSIKLATTTAETDTTSIAALSTMLEARDLQQLKYGTASAESMTLSFWVKSYQTGTYSFVIQAPDLNHAIYGSLYTINSSNTWEKKTITIPAPSLASSTPIANDKTLGLEMVWQFTYRDSAGTLTNNSWNDTTAISGMRWWSVNGQTINGSTSTNNYIQITGVKLEVGSVATEFDHRSYGEELALCQRYFERMTNETTSSGTYHSRKLFAMGYAESTSEGRCALRYATKRSEPTITYNSLSALAFYHTGSTLALSSLSFDNASLDVARVLGTSSGTPLIDGSACHFSSISSSIEAYVDIDAEL